MSFRCHCWNKENWALNGECLTPQLVHKATKINAVNEDTKKYIGLADTTFKSVLKCQCLLTKFCL